MLLAGLVVGSPAEATAPAVTIRTVSDKLVVPGGHAVVKPSYRARSRASVRSARISVRRSTTWVARDVRSKSLAAGTYRVTTTVKYRLRSHGHLGSLRAVSRTQWLTVRTATPADPTPTVSRPSSASSTGTPCDSTSLPKDDGGTWTCTFSDDFSGSSLDRTKWLVQKTADSSYMLGGDCFVDQPGNVSVGGGALSLTVREEASPFTCHSPSGDYTSRYTAGMVTTWSSFAQTRGRFEIRAAFPSSVKPGLHGALWLWPKESAYYGGWPLSGEIDLAEFYTSWPDRVIPFLHYGSTPLADPVTNNYCMVTDPSAFHTYTLEWTATTMTIAYDGRICLSHRISPLAPLTGSAPFDRPFLIALTQGLGLGDNAVTSGSDLPATTKVDYVRAWS